MATVTGHPDWQGISQLSQAAASIFVLNHQVAPAGNFSESGPITRQGYEIFLVLENTTAAATQTPVLIELFWSDESTSIVTGYQRWWVYSAPSGSQHVINGHGPSNGNVLTVKIGNQSGTAPTLSVGYCVLDVARPYVTHDWRTRDDLSPTYAGWTAATSDLGADVIATFAGLSVPAGQTVRQLLPLFTGSSLGQASAVNSTGADLLVQTAADLLIGTQQTVAELRVQTSGPLLTQFSMPRVQCQAAWRNQITVAQSVFGTLSVIEQR